MTDEEVIRAVQQIKATASPAGGALAERLGDEILSLNAKRKLVFDAWESDRKEIKELKKSVVEIIGVVRHDFDEEDFGEGEFESACRQLERVLSIAEKTLNG